MITKTSIRFFNKVPVRARWDDEKDFRSGNNEWCKTGGSW